MNEGAEKARLGGIRFAKILVWIVYAYFIAAVIILILTFFLELFNASTDAAFTQWVYRTADSVLAPFAGIFPSVEAENGSIVDFAVVFAIIMYGIFAMVVHALVNWLDDRVSAERLKVQRAQWAAQAEGAAASASAAAPVAGAPAVSASVAPAPSPLPYTDPAQPTPKGAGEV